MEKEGNLLVTFDPSHEESALKEISSLLNEIQETVEIIKAEDGIAEVLVKDAKKAVSELSKICKDNLDKFNYTSHWVPIEKWCDAEIDEIKKIVKELGERIKDDERWKMDLKVRKVKEKPDEIKLIVKLTEAVDKPKVDLKNPEKIIKVEIIGNRAGLSLLDIDELLNVAKLKHCLLYTSPSPRDSA